MKNPQWLLESKKPWEHSKVVTYSKSKNKEVLNKDEFESKFLKTKYGWKDNMYYEELLAKKTKQDQKEIDSMFKALQHFEKINKSKRRIKLLEKPPVTSIFEISADKKEKPDTSKKKAVKKEGPRCDALKMDGKVCGALLKDGNKKCKRHTPKPKTK